MSVAGAAPPPEPLKGGPRQIGPFVATAQIGVGRRTIALIGHGDRPDELLALRELRSGIDPDVFEAEVRGQRQFDAGPSLVEVERIASGAIAFGPLAIGESAATIIEHAIAEQKPIDLDIALAIAMAIANKLAKTGDKRCHADLVPHHAIVCYDGSIQLIDAAPSAYRERMKAPSRIGYRAPEELRGDFVGPQADVFLLGIMLFEMTTATRLFGMATSRDAESAITEGRLPRPRDLVGDSYPIELQLVLRKLLRPTPAGRFADGGAARDALRLVAAARTEITQGQIGGWLERTFASRHAAWRSIVGDLMPADGEHSSSKNRARVTSRSPTSKDSDGRYRIERRDTVPRVTLPPALESKGSLRAIPADATEPALPIFRMSGTRDRPNERAATELAAPPRQMLQDGPTLITQRLMVEEDNSVEIDEDETHTDVPHAPINSERYATKVALEGIEALDDRPPRVRHSSESGTKTDPPQLSEIKAQPVSAKDAVYGETVTPLMEVELTPGGFQDANGTRVPVDTLFSVGPLESAAGATPTPLIEVDPEPSPTPLPILDHEPESEPDPDTDEAPELSDHGPLEFGARAETEEGIAPDFSARISTDESQAPDFVSGMQTTETRKPNIDELASEETDDDYAPSAPMLDDSAISEAPFELSIEELIQEKLDAQFDQGEETAESIDPLPRAPSNVASDLLLPAPPARSRGHGRVVADLTSDLLEAETNSLDEAPHTIRASRPGVDLDIDANDTIDESACDALPSDVVAPTAQASEQQDGGAWRAPPPHPASSSSIGIPPSNTMPTAAKPSWTIQETRPPAKGAALGNAPLWAPPPTLEAEGEPPFSQANVPTQIVRERVGPPDTDPKLQTQGPSKSGSRSLQASVPTMIVRERVSAPDPEPLGARVTEQLALVEDSSRESLVIPIPDDELERAARRRKRLLVAAIITGILLTLATGALLAFTMLGSDIRITAKPLGTNGDDGNIVHVPTREVKALEEPAPVEAVTATVVAKAAASATAAAAAADEEEEEDEAPTRAETKAPVNPVDVTKVHVIVRPRGAKILAGGSEVENDGDIEIGDEPVDIAVSAPGYVEHRETRMPGDARPLRVLLRKKRR